MDLVAIALITIYVAVLSVSGDFPDNIRGVAISWAFVAFNGACDNSPGWRFDGMAYGPSGNYQYRNRIPRPF